MLLVCAGSGTWLALGCQGKAKEDGEVHVAQGSLGCGEIGKGNFLLFRSGQGLR